jgi:hypothetical protein
MRDNGEIADVLDRRGRHGAADNTLIERLQVSQAVMAGLVPAIHVFVVVKTWMPGTRPGMTWKATS